MKDRTPRYPGRIKLTHEDGTVEYVTIERADDPVEPGTPLNKATLLTEETGGMLGLDDTGTVNDALQRIIMSAVSETVARTEMDDLEIQFGQCVISSTTSVTFEHAFTGIPLVFAFVPHSSTVYLALVSNVTATGFSAAIRTASGSSVSGQTLNYLAIYNGGGST
jgi:hypothetical protein